MVQYDADLDAGFHAIAAGTRRDILQELGRGEASVSDLARRCGITLTGVKKHLRVLEQARLVTTLKTGRVRSCRLGPRRLEREATWIEQYQRMWGVRLEHPHDSPGRTDRGAR